MSNPSKAKGTGGENEVRDILLEAGHAARRTSPGLPYDVFVPGRGTTEPFQVLATRPDRGRWLATVPLEDLAELVRYYNRGEANYGMQVEVKRYSRFALHTIFESKFGKRK